MKENYTHLSLYPNNEVGISVGDYAFGHSTKLPQHITDHHAWGVSSQEKADYMISPLQAQFLVWMAKATGAKRILEIGTFIGFSTLGWSHAVGEAGHVTTLEFSAEYASIAQETFAKNHIKNIDVIVGDAKESLKTLAINLTEPYDLIFIDADKTSYPTYLSLILTLSAASSSTTRVLKPGGIILADNILRRGLVADTSSANPWADASRQAGKSSWKQGDVEALRDFNDMMIGSERIETILLPLFDGVGMGRLID
ncbi:hypothetical protein B7494_g5040 [Chlorociboria aeruginascens]|nr:hypothetical protein B7494_g5040 [Chlorociboria aeruginascens]